MEFGICALFQMKYKSQIINEIVYGHVVFISKKIYIYIQ